MYPNGYNVLIARVLKKLINEDYFNLSIKTLSYICCLNRLAEHYIQSSGKIKKKKSIAYCVIPVRFTHSR